jgi:hypothetical protein
MPDQTVYLVIDHDRRVTDVLTTPDAADYLASLTGASVEPHAVSSAIAPHWR